MGTAFFYRKTPLGYTLTEENTSIHVVDWEAGMFESAELGHKIKKTEYEKAVPALREALLNVQMEQIGRASCRERVLTDV